MGTMTVFSPQKHMPRAASIDASDHPQIEGIMESCDLCRGDVIDFAIAEPVVTITAFDTMPPTYPILGPKRSGLR